MTRLADWAMQTLGKAVGSALIAVAASGLLAALSGGLWLAALGGVIGWAVFAWVLYSASAPLPPVYDAGEDDGDAQTGG